jgi:FkbM family methyltransferase
MSIAELAPIFSGPDKWPRVYGLVRSLAIYHGGLSRSRKLKQLYGSFMEPGDLAFDIGAHVGDRTRAWASLGARVVAIEPQADLAAWLRWLFKGRDDVQVVETALGADIGSATLQADPTNPTVSTLSGDWIAQVVEGGGFESVSWRASSQVAVTTLDRLIETYGEPAFCKIDVEGFEAEVLKGLSRPLKAVSIEFLPAVLDVAIEAVDLLEKLGRYRYNVSFGESMSFELADWQSADRIKDWLLQQRGGRSSGDVYARIES